MTDFEQLIVAAISGNYTKVTDLLDADPHLINKKDQDGATALHWAALNGRRDIAQLLLQRGADPNSLDNLYNATPAGWAIEYLREYNAFLGIELQDFAHAIQQNDTPWVARWLQRFPNLRNATAPDGTPFRQLANQATKEIQQLFEETR